MDDPERINLFMKHYNLTPTLLAEKIGKKRPQVIYDIQKGKQGISKNIAGLIYNSFPEISYAWLLGESGNMLKEKNDRQRGPIFAKSGRDSNIATNSSSINSGSQDVNNEIWNELQKEKQQNAVMQEIINQKNEEIIKLNREIVELYKEKSVIRET